MSLTPSLKHLGHKHPAYETVLNLLNILSFTLYDIYYRPSLYPARHHITFTTITSHITHHISHHISHHICKNQMEERTVYDLLVYKVPSWDQTLPTLSLKVSTHPDVSSQGETKQEYQSKAHLHRYAPRPSCLKLIFNKKKVRPRKHPSKRFTIPAS
jgi:hypothetical protein